MTLQRVPAFRRVLSGFRVSVFLQHVAYILALCCWLFLPSSASAATTVPMEAQLPGTQPNEAGNIDLVGNCDNCHQDTSNPARWTRSDLLGDGGHRRAGLRRRR
jgi:hypothetical protein